MGDRLGRFLPLFAVCMAHVIPHEEVLLDGRTDGQETAGSESRAADEKESGV
ncbi:MAG TPA: hypothetical protein VN087_06940 [Verrucomicrobiae bacterium]|nr:hypothetical protein [Verrucomicrobiae bacterium]